MASIYLLILNLLVGVHFEKRSPIHLDLISSAAHFYLILFSMCLFVVSAFSFLFCYACMRYNYFHTVHLKASIKCEMGITITKNYWSMG
jgi:hypothetical protein